MKESTRVLLALAIAIAGGLAVAASESPLLLRAADAVAPVGTLWVNAIRMTVLPLIVSLIITGVASASNVATVGKLGVRTLVVFLLLLVGTAIVVMPFAPSLFALLPNDATRPPLPPGAAEAATEVATSQGLTVAQWLTSLIPSNPIAAAATGQIIPLVIFTLLLAIAVANSPSAARTTLVNFFQALGDVLLVLVRWVILLAPIGVFALVLPLAAHAGASFVGAIGFYIVAYSVACLVATALLYPAAVMFGRVPIRQFTRAALPAQLVAFSTSSSVAALPALVEAGRALKLPERVNGFVLPLAVAMFKIAAPVSWTVGALFIGWFYDVPLGIRELSTIAFTAVFLSFAGPGIPRGAFISLAPLFVTIGLPPEGIGVLIAVDALPDVFATVLNTTGNLTAVTIVARGERQSELQQTNEALAA